MESKADYTKGYRACPNCGYAMYRKPYKETFIQKEDGFDVVDISGKDGKIVKSKIEPEFLWCCTKCSRALW